MQIDKLAEMVTEYNDKYDLDLHFESEDSPHLEKFRHMVVAHLVTNRDEIARLLSQSDHTRMAEILEAAVRAEITHGMDAAIQLRKSPSYCATEDLGRAADAILTVGRGAMLSIWELAYADTGKNFDDWMYDAANYVADMRKPDHLSVVH